MESLAGAIIFAGMVCFLVYKYCTAYLPEVRKYIYDTDKNMEVAQQLHSFSFGSGHVVLLICALISIAMVRGRPDFIRRIPGPVFLFLYPLIALAGYGVFYVLSEIFFESKREEYAKSLKEVRFMDDDLLFLAGCSGFFYGGYQLIKAYVSGMLTRADSTNKYARYFNCTFSTKLLSEKEKNTERSKNLKNIIDYINKKRNKDNKDTKVSFETDFFLFFASKYRMHKLPSGWLSILNSLRITLSYYYGGIHFFVFSLGISKFIMGIENNKSVGFLAIELLIYLLVMLFGFLSQAQKKKFKSILVNEEIFSNEISHFKQEVEEYEKGKTDQELADDLAHKEKKILRLYCFEANQRQVNSTGYVYDSNIASMISYETRMEYESLIARIREENRQNSSGCSSCGSCSSCSSCGGCGGCGGE